MTETRQTTKVLMELRTCFERFAGIPQETRLLFSAFLDSAPVEVHGLINHAAYRLARGLVPGKQYDDDTVNERQDRLSRFAISTRGPDYGDRITASVYKTRRALAPTQMAAMSWLGLWQKMYEFDARDHADFTWDTFFAITLPPEEIDKIARAGYRTLSPSWHSMQRAGLIGGKRLGRYPVLDTRGYDVFFSQTPFPARMSHGCRLVVRYHDAIPMYLPHTIHTAGFHQKSHYRALRDNAAHAVFACTSEAARSDLLKIFPALESRTPVVHDVVSDSYFPEASRPGAVTEIVRSRTNPHTEPKWQSAREKERFYGRMSSKPLRYLLMVSTIEPRKNHLRLIRAWERLRAEDPELKLVIVGALGWGVDPVVEAMRPWQERGELFNLSSVPAGDLRRLYGAAACVVCPSVAEGFDLSGIEAMLCGAAVAASDIPVHREVYGDCAGYFGRHSVSALTETIAQLIAPENAAENQALRARGLEHAQRYKRDVIAPQWEALFERVRAGGHSA